jgi:hypothetical protein
VADRKKEREERLAAALRENLKRRKEAARAAEKERVVPAKAGTSGHEDAGDETR